MGKNPKLNDFRVRSYTTVDTPLDQFHGTDAFMELVLKDKESILVRIGATTANESVKSDRGSKKSDIEIEEEWLNAEDEEGLTNQKIPKLAEQISLYFDKHLESDTKMKDVA